MFVPGKLFQPSPIFAGKAFRISATFEMIRTESDEMCISIDQEHGGAAPFIQREREPGRGETERERICGCASVGQNQR